MDCYSQYSSLPPPTFRISHSLGSSDWIWYVAKTDLEFLIPPSTYLPTDCIIGLWPWHLALFFFSKTWFLSVAQASLELESSAASAFVVLGLQARYHHAIQDQWWMLRFSVRVHVHMEARDKFGCLLSLSTLMPWDRKLTRFWLGWLAKTLWIQFLSYSYKLLCLFCS